VSRRSLAWGQGLLEKLVPDPQKSACSRCPPQSAYPWLSKRHSKGKLACRTIHRPEFAARSETLLENFKGLGSGRGLAAVPAAEPYRSRSRPGRAEHPVEGAAVARVEGGCRRRAGWPCFQGLASRIIAVPQSIKGAVQL